MVFGVFKVKCFIRLILQKFPLPRHDVQCTAATKDHCSRCTIHLPNLVGLIWNSDQIRSLEISGFHTGDSDEKLHIEFLASPDLQHKVYEINKLVLRNLRCSWNHLAILMKQFHIVDNYFPEVYNNDDVYSDLTPVVNFKIQGLQLISWSPADEVIMSKNAISYDARSSSAVSKDPHGISSAESWIKTTTSLVILHGNVRYYGDRTPPVAIDDIFTNNITLPRILKTNLWPQLKYLELEVTQINVFDMLTLKTTMPKLNYLKLYVPLEGIPEEIWTFDWNLLPWRTGFVAVYTNPSNLCDEHVKLNLKNKVTVNTIPPVNFYDAVDRYGYCDNYLKLNLDIDFSNNNLSSLGYFQFTFEGNFNIKLNLSHNNLTSVALSNRYNVIRHASYHKRDCDVIAKVRMLDLSFNHLHDSSRLSSDFLLLKHLKELYLDHNYLTKLPKHKTLFHGKEYTFRLKHLEELSILHMEHNLLITSDVNFDELSYDEFSSLREIYFQGNFLTTMPAFIYKAKYLTVADFSDNFISYYEISPYNPEIDIKNSGQERTAIHLESNLISVLDLSAITIEHLPLIDNAIANFHIYMDGNPVNCSCSTHGMYKYLISLSRSLRPTKQPLDFSFYETDWKCRFPSQWSEIPLMQIPEYEYDQMCVPSLYNCSVSCFCYHSWKHGDVIVSNCSHGDEEHVLSTLPETVPDATSNLILSHNNIQLLCNTHPYFENLKVLDLSWNAIYLVCSNFFSELTNLTELNLSFNKLTTLPPDVKHMINLRELYLTDALLETLPQEIENMQNMNITDISGNLFRCDCDTFWMSPWLVKFNNIVENPHGITCFSGQGRGKRLIDLQQDDVGCNDPLLHALIGLAVTVVLVAIFITVVYRYRGYIKIWLYTRFGFHPWDQSRENTDNKDYDAFVSFCHKDSRWVIGTLLPYLEAPQCGFHLCVHNRDFVPGVAITKNIMTAIEYSRRTILVLTPDFIKSGWCDLEFQAAHRKALDDRSNFLIVIILKEVGQKHLDETLKLYMKTKTYLTFDDTWFWQKMLYAMPKVPIDRIKSASGSNDNQRSSAPTSRSKTSNEASNSFYDVSTDSDLENCKDKIFRRRTRKEMIAKLPPLFKRINSYNEILARESNKE